MGGLAVNTGTGSGPANASASASATSRSTSTRIRSSTCGLHPDAIRCCSRLRIGSPVSAAQPQFIRVAVNGFVIGVRVAGQTLDVKHDHRRRSVPPELVDHAFHPLPSRDHVPPVDAMDRHAQERVGFPVRE